jgi:hypothetical protein
LATKQGKSYAARHRNVRQSIVRPTLGMLGAPASSSRLAGLPGDVAWLGAGRGEMDQGGRPGPMISANQAGKLMVSARTSSGLPGPGCAQKQTHKALATTRSGAVTRSPP